MYLPVFAFEKGQKTLISKEQLERKNKKETRRIRENNWRGRIKKEIERIRENN